MGYISKPIPWVPFAFAPPPKKIFILIASRALNELFIATRGAERNYLKHRAPLKPVKTLTRNSKNNSHNHEKTIDETLLWLFLGWLNDDKVGAGPRGHNDKIFGFFNQKMVRAATNIIILCTAPLVRSTLENNIKARRQRELTVVEDWNCPGLDV